MVVRGLDYDGVGEHALDLLDAAFDKGLLGADVFVFGAFWAPTSSLASWMCLGNLGAADGGQLVKLFLELVVAFLGKRYLLGYHGGWGLLKKTDRWPVPGSHG